MVRGPVVYCAEDVDNEWVDDDFKVRFIHCFTPAALAALTMSQKVRLRPDCKIYEHAVNDKTTGDSFVSLTVTEGVSTVDLETRVAGLPWMGVQGGGSAESKGPKDLRLVPYYFRANRGGKGMMRVGFGRAS